MATRWVDRLGAWTTYLHDSWDCCLLEEQKHSPYGSTLPFLGYDTFSVLEHPMTVEEMDLEIDWVRHLDV